MGGGAGVIGVGAAFDCLFAFDVGCFCFTGFRIGGEAVGVGIVFRFLGRLLGGDVWIDGHKDLRGYLWLGFGFGQQADGDKSFFVFNSL